MSEGMRGGRREGGREMGANDMQGVVDQSIHKVGGRGR
jgi:hypothetical protein